MIFTANTVKELDLQQLYYAYTEQPDNSKEEFGSRKTVRIVCSPAENEFFEGIYDFFSVLGSGYCIMELDGKYLCCMRFEPYEDGKLISCLQTRKSERRKGYALEMMTEYLKSQKCRVYSHVANNNVPSLRLHKKCGFRVISDTAKLLDGTVSSRYVTMVSEPDKE